VIDTYASIAELGARLRAKALTSLQLTEAYLARIDQIAPKLNSFVTVTADVARAQARRADDELAAGHDRGPLHGIPYAVKDLIDTAGIRTTWGCKAMLDRVPTVDAHVVERLREAGAVLLGKLSLTELANAFDNKLDSANHNGPHRNPWDLTRWAGGSSAGAGSAVAAGLCAFALGTETWGSIDCPAAYCGVSGLRPTFGVVHLGGALVLCPTLDKIGPLARSAADLGVVLGALAESPLDDAPTTPLRVGVLQRPPMPPEPELITAFARLQDTLRAGGARLETLELPKHPGNATLTIILIGELFAALDGFIQSGAVHQLYDREPWETKWKAYLDLGTRADDYVKAMYARTAIQRDYRALFERFDVLLSPGRRLATVIDAPASPDDTGGDHELLSVAGNLAGLPALTLPIGFTASGLPMSMHAVAAPYREANLLALGALVQSRTEHHQRRPPLG
jgi:aspartyl-tRNA(Asn)/glutamyl-tRNA(Gln) amidotransferase subunit A